MTGIDAPSELPAPAEEVKKPEIKNPKSFSLLSLLALVIALIALAVSLYLLMQEKRTQQVLHHQQTMQETREGQLTHKINQLQESIVELENLKKENEETWLSGKARSLLELAQMEIHWGNDTNTVIALMKQADATLSRMHAPGLLPVRQTLADDIARIQAKPKLDIAGLASQLDAVRNQINNLPVQTKTLPNAAPTNSPPPAESTWRKHLDESLAVLEKMVVIQKQDTTINPQLSAMHLSLLKESIRNNLQAAQWAILHQNEAIYQSSLKQALSQITSHFDNQADITRAVIKQLQTLQQIKLENAKDTVQASLNKLNEWIDHSSQPHAMEQ